MRRMIRRGSKQLETVLAAGVVLGLVGFATPAALAGEEPAFLAFGAGVYDVFDDHTTAEFRLEYRSDIRFWKFAPFIGAMTNAEGALYGYAGLGLDIFLGDHFVVTPNAAFGAYYDGSSKDLVGTLEFRTGGEFAYRFNDASRLGLAFNHISNASIYDSNPGTESLVIMYALPLGIGSPP